MEDPLACANVLVRLGIRAHQPVAHPALHKLLFIAAGVHAADHGTPLMSEPLHVAAYGPQVRSVYRVFLPVGAGPITAPGRELRADGRWWRWVEPADVSPDAAATLADVWEAGSDPVALMQLMHAGGSPYLQARDSGRATIDPDALRTWFARA